MSASYRPVVRAFHSRREPVWRFALRLTGDQQLSKPKAAGENGLEDGRLRLGQPTMLHPTYRERYVLCGPLVVFRENADGTLLDLTAADIATATSIYDTHRV
jgi:hypothetical protein